MSVSRKAGRPTCYTLSIADEICDRLAAGESLRKICQDVHMPSDALVQEWVRADSEERPAFVERYARAREQSCAAMAEEILQIADADYTGPNGYTDNGAVQQARLRIDTRKWLLSKMLPRQYGDRVTQEIVGDADRPVITRLELVPIIPTPRAQALETSTGRLIHLAAETEAKRK